MIRYPVTEDELRKKIEEEARGWLNRAAQRTARFREARQYDEPSGIWSEIKPVYMKLQRNKCAYCERKLAGLPHGLIEHDVEHFRPKRAVDAYPPNHDKYGRHLLRYDFSTGGAFPDGYYLLAYHPLNYVAVCKPCNTPLKANFFPISGTRHADAEHPRDLSSEKAWLIYPLGDGDDDPEDVLTFTGIIPRPKHTFGEKMNRAQVIIDFFRLDTREELRQERASQIVALYLALDGAKNNPDLGMRSHFAKHVQRLIARGAPHCNCLRSFRRFYEDDPRQARYYVEEAGEFLDSIGS